MQPLKRYQSDGEGAASSLSSRPRRRAAPSFDAYSGLSVVIVALSSFFTLRANRPGGSPATLSRPFAGPYGILGALTVIVSSPLLVMRLRPRPPKPVHPPSQEEEREAEEDAQQAKPQGLFPRPFEGHYGVSVAVAIIALSPFIVVSTADLLFARHVQADLHMSRFGTDLIAGFSIAGYAFGAFTGGDLVQRFRQRHLFFICEAMFAAGCAITAVAHGPYMYGFGRIFSGLATGLLLVVAIPPVIQNFPAEKLKVTVVWINLGFFGAVCIGPLLGGVTATGHDWRWFFAGLGILAFLNLIVSFFTQPFKDPPNPKLKLDPWAGILGFGAVVLPFWATSDLTNHSFASVPFIVLLTLGVACFVALLLVEYHQKEPLSPVKNLWTTISLIGTLVAMIAGSVFVSFLELAERLQMEVAHRTPFWTGVLFSPLVGGVLITAMLLGLLLQTRYLPILVLAGMACLAGAGALIMTIGPRGGQTATLAAAVLLGLGAGATVSPGLYLAGLPVVSKIIGRVFALVELVRSLADYVIAPVILKIAELGSHKKPLDWPGVHEAAMITLWITIGFTIFGFLLWMAGATGLPKPDIKAWIEDNEPAFESPRLFARFRKS